MCGRFTLKTNPALWGQFLLPGLPWHELAQTDLADWQPRYNIAPTQTIIALAKRPGEAALSILKCRWGLVPSWSDDISIGNRMINARGETLVDKPSFRSAISKRRCVILADGYYEWQKGSGKEPKQPFWIHQNGEPVFAMAGLWERNTKATDGELLTASIITVAANDTLADLHDRMPAILAPESIDSWLDPEFTDGSAAQSMLSSAPESWFVFRPVSTRVNSPKHDSAECLEI